MFPCQYPSRPSDPPVPTLAVESLHPQIKTMRAVPLMAASCDKAKIFLRLHIIQIEGDRPVGMLPEPQGGPRRSAVSDLGAGYIRGPYRLYYRQSGRAAGDNPRQGDGRGNAGYLRQIRYLAGPHRRYRRLRCRCARGEGDQRVHHRTGEPALVRRRARRPLRLPPRRACAPAWV